MTVLTKRQREVLQRMADDPHGDNGELVLEHGEAWIGNEKTSSVLVDALLRHMAISLEQGCTLGDFERYRINETGRGLLGQKP